MNLKPKAKRFFAIASICGLMAQICGYCIPPDNLKRTFEAGDTSDPALTETLHPTKRAYTLQVLNGQLFEAVKNNDLSQVINCLENGADPNATQAPNQNAPLHYSAQNNNIAITKTLLLYGADVRIKNRLGLMPLHYAWFYKSGIVQIFLNHVLRSYPARPAVSVT